MARPGPDATLLPLAGLRVVEVAENLAGPWAARILADMGADVVKVERPAPGDPSRQWGPPFVAGDSTLFAFANAGKRSVALDLRDSADRTVLDGLIAQADVLIQALRPGAFEALGYGWPRLREGNPRLIFASVLAYGAEGPLSHLPGYDPLMQAQSGIMSVTGPAGGEPARVGTSIVDLATGMWLAIGILAALRQRDQTGEGREVSAALFDTALSWSGYHLLGVHSEGHIPVPMGTEMGMIAPYGAFPTEDGPLMVAAGNDALFRRLVEALELSHLAADPDFADNARRVAHRERLTELLAERTRRLSRDALLARLREAGVPAAPIQDMGEVVRDPQTRASGMLGALPDPPILPSGGGSGYPITALPLRWEGARFTPGGPHPRHDAHGPELRGGEGRRVHPARGPFRDPSS